VHFMFRLDVPIVRKDPRGARYNQEGGYLAQCISSPVEFPFVNTLAKQRLWSTYQKLSLRLRLRSATVEATLDAFDMIQREHEAKHSHFPGIGKDCPAMELVESSPTFQDGISYVVDGYDTFLALSGKSCGKNFELYMAASSTIPIKQIAAQGARLARRLTMEQHTLFLSQPLAWNE